MFFLLFSSVCFSNDKKKVIDILKKTSEYYSSKKQFEIKMTYKIYPSASSKKANEIYTGSIIKHNSNYYSKIDNTEIINGKGFSLKIDNKEKTMQYQPYQSEHENTFTDLKNYCSYFNGFRITESGSQWICIMTTPDISFVPYSKLIIHINKSDYSMSKQIIYFLTPDETTDKKGNTVINYPRMEIDFLDFKLQINPLLFNINNYLILKKDKVYTNKKYESYEIVE